MRITRVFRAFLTQGLGFSLDWMPMKDRDIGDKLWTCAVGSSSGETLFCDPKLLCNEDLAKVPEDWVIPSSLSLKKYSLKVRMMFPSLR